MRFSRRNLLLQATATAAAVPLGYPVKASSPLRADRTAGVDAELQASIDAGDAPGIVAMAATERSIWYQGSFGRRDASGEAKMTMDTIFRIASMVKLLTSVAALQLVEQGRLKLDEPAAKIDATLASPSVLVGFDAEGAPQLRAARNPITLRNLLSHTSGFSYQLWDVNVVRYQERAKAGKSKRSLPRMPLMFDPGTRWAYGSSIDRVGRLVEIASGKTLDHYFRDHITGPLGMIDTAFTLTESQRAREASLHFREADGKLASEPTEKRVTAPKGFLGGGGIYSTAPDFLRLLQALLNQGSLDRKTILRPTTVALMGSNQIGEIEAGKLKTTNPALSNDVDFFPGIRLRWGLGHMINLDPVKNGRRAGSLTWAGLYNTYYWIDPASGIVAVIMMQILPFADQRALAVYRHFERGVYRFLVPA